MSEQNSDAASRNYKRHGARYKARRRAADILFEAEIRDVDPVGIVEERVQLSADPLNQVAPVAEYSRSIVAGVAEELDRIDQSIALYLSEEWSLDRIPAVDRAVLRVAMWELLFNDEVAPKTALVEAVEIASHYSPDDSPAYIHALLDSAIANLEQLRQSPESLLSPVEDLLAPSSDEELMELLSDPAELELADPDPDSEANPESSSLPEPSEPVESPASTEIPVKTASTDSEVLALQDSAEVESFVQQPTDDKIAETNPDNV